MRAAALVAVVLVLAGCAAGSPSSTYRAASVPEAKRLMVDYLAERHLTWHWVACLKSGRDFAGVPIVRCNVNFGDPHIEAYCIVLRFGRFYSDHQEPRIPCQRDNRAPPATIVSS